MAHWVKLFLLLFSFHSYAIDTVKIATGHSHTDIRYLYNKELLIKALEVTSSSFGLYQLSVLKGAIPNPRRLNALKQGVVLNVAGMLANDNWDRNAIRVKTPIRRGIFNYRLLLINKNNLSKFKHISSIETLKTLSVGLRRGWKTHKIMQHLGFNVASSHNYDSLFAMLNKNRFDYIPRGVHEIYPELAAQSKQFKNLTIEPKLAIYMPLPEYFYVSPLTPSLAVRLDHGIKILLENGFVDQLLDQYYGDFIHQADINNRTIINVGNPFIDQSQKLQTPHQWYNKQEN
ncbi:hypothetical protein DS2_13819 [Catenovulum agarivorans DS-2]|uniref:Solute-binding protein family 3/N-terminal domain-containing protein n=1 Tax=Catenovulum agarivorans DS-2 TaxID=1328313 RepID=W7QV31_9ALTE|nr:ABC transporter substrate-binding protein [Catenovulum agarivorans]EWH09155.1 hypothetical protein DS2_13819 [Catenovulum agarivorans DS-2]